MIADDLPAPIALADAIGCVLAKPVRAPEDQPAFDRSAVDGYVVAGASDKELWPSALATRFESRQGFDGARPGKALQ
ncbi:MAG: hypothetical protein ACLFUF_02390 [Opitutales bacterium]